MNDKARENWLILAHGLFMDGRAASLTVTDKLPHFVARGINPVLVSSVTGAKSNEYTHYRCISPAPSGIRFDIRHAVRHISDKRWVQKLIKSAVTLPVFPLYGIESALIRYDAQWSWFAAGFLLGYHAIKKHDIKVIYSSGGPPSVHHAAWYLKKLTGLPWIAEIHDPIIMDPPTVKASYHNYKARIEAKLAKDCDAMFYFTEKALQSGKERHPEMRGHLIRPGVAQPDFGDATYRKGDRFRIGHFGSLSPTRNLRTVIQALKNFEDEVPESRDKIQLEVYGVGLDRESREAIQQHNAQHLVIEKGRLETDPETGKSGRQQVLEAMRQMDLLLVVHGDDRISREYIPSKTYEYLWTSRPILGIVDKGSELDELLVTRGHTTTDEKIDAICKKLNEAWDKWQKNELTDQTSPKPLRVEDAVEQILRLRKSIH